MPDARGSIRYLKRLPEYEKVKPYLAAVLPQHGRHLEDFPLTNLEFDEETVDVTDIRPNLRQVSLEENGFEIFPLSGPQKVLSTVDDVAEYQRETEKLLAAHFGAEKVISFEFKSRKNAPFGSDTLDLDDPMQHLQPAPDAHADYTFVSGPITAKRTLIEHGQEKYMAPGYRFRIVNTWQSALPQITDLPLALCDFSTIEEDDPVASDRVRPDKSGEIFHLHFNPRHKWYFLDSITPKEPWLFVSYDSLAGPQARFCPHATFHPEGRKVSVRESYETRNLVITRIPPKSPEGEDAPAGDRQE